MEGDKPSEDMMNLSGIMQIVYQRLGQTHIDKATGGSTTTVVDSNLLDRFSDDDFEERGAAVFIVRTTDGAAPQGEYANITGYSQDTYTFDTDTFSAAVGSGDTYLVTAPTFPLNQMVEAVNSALRKLGDVPDVYTSLTTVANQYEYDLPLSVKRNKPYRVEVLDGDEYREIGFDIIPSTAGSVGKLRIQGQSEGMSMRIWYQGEHPTVDSYADYISEYIHPELLVNAVLVEILDWYNSRTSGTDKYWLGRQGKAEQDFANSKVEFKTWKPVRKSRGMPHWIPQRHDREYWLMKYGDNQE